MIPKDELIKNLTEIDVTYLAEGKISRPVDKPPLPKATPSPIKIKLNPGETARVEFQFRVGTQDHFVVYEAPATFEGGVVVYTIGEAEGCFRLYDEGGADVTHTYRGYCQR